MAKVRKFTANAEKNRERVRKHRRIKKFKEKYQNNVHAEMLRRSEIDFDVQNTNADVPNEHINSENQSGENFQDCLKEWAVKHRITKMALNDLLSILITAGFCYLPKDSRTLMKTPKHVEIRNLSSGQMWYRGISFSLLQIFQKLNNDISIYLDFNFDGVPLFDSSSKCFWPIIVSIRGDSQS